MVISPITIGIVKDPDVFSADVAVIVMVGIGVLPSLTALIPSGVDMVPTVHATCSSPHKAMICNVVDCVPLTLFVVPINV